MHRDKSINYIELPAKDLSAAKSFYSKTFGWSFQDYGPDYTAFNDGFFDGGFYHAPLHSQADHGAALVVLYAKKLEEVLEEVLRNGGTICRDIFSFPGGRRFHFQDPNGNELAVWSELAEGDGK
ncbi:VOC family protein [Flexibacterium corallicola]|uniref:VOC family protein n=1 Tax=Flexibacterium corallicola TaxID=3037259 RepID=UPI00286F3E53|nr:VOC family protein [Pseudovibrio sp. M1P-2-3]